MSNEDFSSISFRKFNLSPEDKYPTITFCIAEGYHCFENNHPRRNENQTCKPIFSRKRLENYNFFHFGILANRKRGNKCYYRGHQ